jgi:rhamnosyltransferase
MAHHRLQKLVVPRLAAKLSPAPAGSTNGHAPTAALQPAAPPAEPRVLFQGTIHRLAGAATDRLVSILIPVKNGAAKLRELLPRLLAQESPDPVEIVAVDSGSTDDSVEVLREHGATVAAIDPRSFNHGLTRNLAAQLARGQIVVFLNQTTLPADEHWLANLVAPLHADPELAAVSARVLPRPDADPLTRKDTERDVSGSPDRAERQIRDWSAYAALSPAELKVFVYFDTICAAIRAEVFRRLPFRQTDFGEDLIWGKEALEAGCKILYEPSAVVLHSHNYSLLEIFRRNFDDGFALRKIIGWEFDDRQVLPEIVGIVRDDWGYLASECGLSGEELEHWWLIAAVRRTAQVLGHWMGVHRDPQTGSLTSRLSITEQIKAGAQTETADGWRT